MYRAYNVVSISKFNHKQGTVRTEKSNAGSRERPISISITSKKWMICWKWKTEDSFTLSGRDLICNKCDHEAKRREKNRRIGAGQGTRTDSAKQTSARVNPQHTKFTARATETKFQKYDQCESSGARSVRLISGMHLLCTVCAAVRYQLEAKSPQEIRSYSEGSPYHRRRVRRGLNHDNSV